MKKNFKKWIAAALCIIMAMSLGGCVTMGELKAEHAYFKADTTDVIIYQDTEYLRLPEYKYFSPNLDPTLDIYITNQDEPMLLKELIGERISISEDHNVLICSYLCTSTPAAYCRADVYDDFVQQIEQIPPMNNYCYSYSKLDEEKNIFYGNYYSLLKQEDIDFITSLMTESNPNVIERDKFDIMSNSLITNIARCSEDMMFKDDVYEIYTDWTDNYYLRKRNSTELVYQVPPLNVAHFKKIFAPALEPYN